MGRKSRLKRERRRQCTPASRSTSLHRDGFCDPRTKEVAPHGGQEYETASCRLCGESVIVSFDGEDTIYQNGKAILNDELLPWERGLCPTCWENTRAVLEYTSGCACGGEKRLATDEEKKAFPLFEHGPPPGTDTIARVCSSCREPSCLGYPKRGL